MHIPEQWRVMMQGDDQMQYEVIRSLAEGVRGMQDAQNAMVERQTEILERLARIEAGRVNEQVDRIGTKLETLNSRIALLELRNAKEDGSSAFLNSVAKFWGPIGSLIGVVAMVLYMLFHATGIITTQPDRVVRSIAQKVGETGEAP